MSASEELCWLTLTQVGEMIKTGEVSSVAVTEMMLARIEQFDSQYHSYFTVMAHWAVTRRTHCC